MRAGSQETVFGPADVFLAVSAFLAPLLIETSHNLVGMVRFVVSLFSFKQIRKIGVSHA